MILEMEMKNIKIHRLIILVLSALGVELSEYLTYLYYAKAHATFCAVGSGCDTVRGSSYSAILGIPVPVFGVIGYLSIFILAFFISIPYRTKWLLLYFLSLAGFAFSAYLTYIELFVIKAICPYCVASAVIITGILITLLPGKPDLSPRISLSKFVTLSGVIVGVVLFSSVFLQSKGLNADSNNSWQVGLAKHLTETGAIMYGSYRCPHCAAQKGLFGEAFKYIRYVECDPTSKEANLALCLEKGIRGYPTWEIRGNFYTGLRSLEELSKLSGYVFSSSYEN
jgi:uncharacterized membrane protein/glutaredoxin